MKYRLNLKLNALRRAARQSPRAFREALQLTNNQLRPANDLFEDWQRTDFAALDDAWKRLAGFDVPPSTRLAYIERPRGHSKTSDMAIQLAWILAFSRQQLHGVAAAADQDQARLIRDAIARLIGLNPYFCKLLEVRQNEILNPETGSRLSIISSDVKSSWGLLPDFVICDELCHWEKPDLWHSLFSAAAKKPDSLLAILTNAGVGRNWQWELREHARTSDTWYFSTLDGPSAPWISSEFLAEQQRLLPEAIYDRIWNNRWQHTSGSFVSAQQVQACRDNELRYQQSGQPDRQYFAAIDYAEKHDYTVGVVLHREGDAGLPEFMLTSDASNANYSSTLVAEGPAVKMFAAEQDFFVREFNALWRMVMSHAVERQLLPADIFEIVEPRWSTPNIVIRDRPKERLADVQLVDAQILSRAEVARRDGVEPSRMRHEIDGETKP